MDKCWVITWVWCKNNLTYKRWVEYLWSECKERLFKNIDISENEKESLLQKLNLAYELSKNEFNKKNRDNWERYFDHLKEVAFIVLREFKNPNLEKILIALLHDIIEDTDIDFYILKKLFGVKVAIWVLALSKEKIKINNIFHKFKINNSWFLDENWNIKEEIKIKKKNNELNEKELKILRIFEHYKEIRNKKYCSTFSTFWTKLNHIKSIAKKYKIKLTKEELIEITKNVLDVKYADRIHNLSTQWDPNNLEKVEQKIEETLDYLLESARENNFDAEVLLLIKLINLKNKFISEWIKGKISSVLDWKKYE